jgi:short-subunit dehydrogenase involved in D-alanine esterification of teichoic acids
MSALAGQAVVVVGRGSGIARAVTLRARAERARVIVAGRDREALADAYLDEPGIQAETVDVTVMTGVALMVDGGEPLT